MKANIELINSLIKADKWTKSAYAYAISVMDCNNIVGISFTNFSKVEVIAEFYALLNDNAIKLLSLTTFKDHTIVIEDNDILVDNEYCVIYKSNNTIIRYDKVLDSEVVLSNRDINKLNIKDNEIHKPLNQRI